MSVGDPYAVFAGELEKTGRLFLLHEELGFIDIDEGFVPLVLGKGTAGEGGIKSQADDRASPQLAAVFTEAIVVGIHENDLTVLNGVDHIDAPFRRREGRL